MKINLIFKNFIILISITTFLKGSFYVNSCNKDEDFKNKYGVQLVLSN
ncbi:hypothetical protein G9F71_021695 [Clostridium sp. FP2]|nr:hypothetical protein [Clostridium sp. FP2]MBZ9625445.1 hypothetical protein [Clostridium sp. FP2]